MKPNDMLAPVALLREGLLAAWYRTREKSSLCMFLQVVPKRIFPSIRFLTDLAFVRSRIIRMRSYLRPRWMFMCSLRSLLFTYETLQLGSSQLNHTGPFPSVNFTSLMRPDIRSDLLMTYVELRMEVGSS